MLSIVGYQKAFDKNNHLLLCHKFGSIFLNNHLKIYFLYLIYRTTKCVNIIFHLTQDFSVYSVIFLRIILRSFTVFDIFFNDLPFYIDGLNNTSCRYLLMM